MSYPHRFGDHRRRHAGRSAAALPALCGEPRQRRSAGPPAGASAGSAASGRRTSYRKAVSAGLEGCSARVCFGSSCLLHCRVSCGSETYNWMCIFRWKLRWGSRQEPRTPPPPPPPPPPLAVRPRRNSTPAPRPPCSEFLLNSVNVAVLGALVTWGAAPRPSGLGIQVRARGAPCTCCLLPAALSHLLCPSMPSPTQRLLHLRPAAARTMAAGCARWRCARPPPTASPPRRRPTTRSTTCRSGARVSEAWLAVGDGRLALLAGTRRCCCTACRRAALGLLRIDCGWGW